MADTEPQEGTQSEPEGQEPKAEPKSEDHRIPKARLDQEASKRKAAEERAAAAEAELAKLREAEPKKAPAEPASKTDNALLERLQAIEERDAIRDLRTEMSLNLDQAKAVHTILKESAGLRAEEALLIARSRDADLFGSQDSRGFNPSQHAGVRPSSGGPPPRKTLKDAAGEINQIGAEHVRVRESARLHGQLVAKALGWERKDDG